MKEQRQTGVLEQRQTDRHLKKKKKEAQIRNLSDGDKSGRKTARAS